MERRAEVSVSLRSIIHSYSVENTTLIKNLKKVSVSLRSIIHSYFSKINLTFEISEKESFRLLTEYHSFLFYKCLYSYDTLIWFPSPYGVSFILILQIKIVLVDNTILSFRLLTEYHSFLFKND